MSQLTHTAQSKTSQNPAGGKISLTEIILWVVFQGITFSLFFLEPSLVFAWAGVLVINLFVFRHLGKLSRNEFNRSSYRLALIAPNSFVILAFLLAFVN